MKIVVICEGATEAAIKDGLRQFVQERSADTNRVGLTTRSLDGPTIRKKLERIVRNLIEQPDVVGVIALTDVYPGHVNAVSAKDALQKAAGVQAKHPAFRLHVALYELEAWLLPFWDEIARYLNVKASPPGCNPEQVNGQRPPSHHLKEVFRKARQEYSKVIHARKWLQASNLERAADACPELRAFLNSLLEIAGAGNRQT